MYTASRCTLKRALLLVQQRRPVTVGAEFKQERAAGAWVSIRCSPLPAPPRPGSPDIATTFWCDRRIQAEGGYERAKPLELDSYAVHRRCGDRITDASAGLSCVSGRKVKKVSKAHKTRKYQWNQWYGTGVAEITAALFPLFSPVRKMYLQYSNLINALSAA